MSTLQFSGYTWLLKHSDSLVGPGPNVFSRDPKDIYVDEHGLHLSISKEGEYWKSTEAILSEPLGYGVYEYTVSTPLRDLQKPSVFGAFLYESDTQEIDIEISPLMVGKKRVQFVIQPGQVQGNLEKIRLPKQGSLNFQIRWLQDHVEFSMKADDRLVTSIYRGPGIHSSLSARFIFNLWLYKGKSPKGSDHVCVSSFSFTPVGELTQRSRT